ELGGGALLDLGVYAVALASDFLGAPTGWAAAIAPSATGVDGTVSLLLTFDGGRQAAIHIGMDHRGSQSASVLGTTGRIDFGFGWHRAGTFVLEDNDGNIVERCAPEVTSRGMQYEAAAFERLIATGAPDSDILPHAD